MNVSHLNAASLGRLYEDGLFTIGKLISDPKTADLLEKIQPAMDGIKEAQAAENAARDHHVLSLGKVASMQSRCEEQFGPLYLDVQRITGNLRDNGDPLARLVFPRGLTGARNLLAPEMRREVRRMHAAIKNEAVAEGLTGHLKPLAELDRTFEKPLNELEQAQGALALAQSKSAQARDVYLDARAVLQSTLAARFPREVRYVNSFFRPGAIAKVKKLPAPVPAPAGVSTVKAQANGAAS